uniref:Uncharacterized protein n=1 Tax=Oryza sativa subsp. japonica TaxID=39947 RepID=Q6K860_ORYSJ|nr:hypothetical protein [Oryza sativa Japonica Group]BAD21769.1 hypothetical protein [Oryza sativa Japonica Group]
MAAGGGGGGSHSGALPLPPQRRPTTRGGWGKGVEGRSHNRAGMKRLGEGRKRHRPAGVEVEMEKMERHV